jgi:uncharacterized protein (TIGR02246 family)
MKTIISALTATTLAFAGSPALAKSTQCAAVTPAQVEAQFGKFNEAWATKDPGKVTALFAKDAVLLATVSNKPRTTPAEINDYFVNFLRGDPVGTIDTSAIRIGCNTAYRMGTWTVALTNQNSGVRNDVKARYSFIYKMEDGEWKIEHLHSSMMPVSEG